jgi:hypothetical protein
MIFSVFGVQGVFYFASWEEYWLKKTRTQVGNFGVTEAQFIHSGVLLISGIYGIEFWDLALPVAPWLTTKVAAVAGNLFAALFIIVSVLAENWTSCKQVGRSYIDLIPFFVHQTIFLIWMTTDSYGAHAWAIVWLHGFVFSKMTCKLLVCACTGM